MSITKRLEKITQELKQKNNIENDDLSKLTHEQRMEKIKCLFIKWINSPIQFSWAVELIFETVNLCTNPEHKNAFDANYNYVATLDKCIIENIQQRPEWYIEQLEYITKNSTTS